MTSRSLSIRAVHLMLWALAFVALLLLRERAGADQVNVTYTTTKPSNANYGNRNVNVVWASNASGFVRTINRRAETQKDELYRWTGENPTWNTETDGKTGATNANVGAYTATWSCNNHAGATVPDGIYSLKFECAANNNPPDNYATYTVNKNGIYSLQTPVDQGGFTGVRIEYIPTTVATLANNPASAITTATARLNGRLINDGGTSATIIAYWGPTDGGATPASWANTASLGVKAVGVFNRTVTGLTPGTTYYFRFAATNGDGTAWASPSLSFQTVGVFTTPNIDLSATTLLFGLTNLGTNRTRSFTITNTGTATLSISAITFAGLDNGVFSLVTPSTTSLAIAAGANQTVTVRFTPAAPQPYNYANMFITSDSPGETLTSLTLKGSSIIPSMKQLVVAGCLGSASHAVAANATAVFAGQGAALTILPANFTAASAPLSRTRLPDVIQKIALSADGAFIAAGNSGLIPVNVTDVASPIALSAIATPDHTFDVAVSGAQLCSADGMGGLSVYDVGSAGALTYRGSYLTQGSARAVKMAGSTAYVVDETSGLLVINVSNPAAPSLTGVCRQVELGQALAVAGAYAYVADKVGGFFVVNVSNPAAPAVVGSVHLSDMGRAVAVKDGVAYVAVGSAGVQAINVSNPAAPVSLGVYNPSGFVADLDVAGGAGEVVYAADELAGVRQVDMSNPASPTDISLYAQQSALAGAAGPLGRLALANGASGLQTMNLAVAPPSALGALDLGATVRAVAVSGSLAFVAASETGLRIVDISNASAPVLRGSYATNGVVSCVAADGPLALVADETTAYGLNVGIPQSPSLLGAWQSADRPCGVAVSGVYGYVADGGGGLRIFDLSHPAPFAPIGSFQTAGPAMSVAVSKNIACVACGRNGLQIVNVSAPALPVPVATVGLPGIAVHVAMKDSLAYISDATGGLSVVDVAVPAAPVYITYTAAPRRAVAVAPNDARLFIADETGGLMWYKTLSIGPDLIRSYLLGRASLDAGLLPLLDVNQDSIVTAADCIRLIELGGRILVP